MRNDTENLIVKLTIEFALDVIEYAELLEDQKKYVVARQLLKSGTSVGANVHEAQNAESKADFIHKMKIAAKEADETEYWITLCNLAKSYPSNELLHEKIKTIIKVISKIISSSKSH
ncbi:MAG: four helix bundle protein [Bacteroidetes bacterium HGW-Bacteroidetes-11]|jgi:four helix bundle protein|nr:MAG: four helix bundle protein [Bacteroidetes bacterium HGW-Bacteroidetes-11]